MRDICKIIRNAKTRFARKEDSHIFSRFIIRFFVKFIIMSMFMFKIN